MTGTLSVAARRIRPVVPPPGAEAVPAEDRARAHDALSALTAAAAHLGDPDLFHRPRTRARLHLRHVGATDPRLLAGQLASAAEQRVAAGLLAVRSVRAELAELAERAAERAAERPGGRPHFTPDALAELHRLLVAADPNIPGGGGFRRATARITWPDGQRFVITVAPGRPLLGQMERWYRWGTRTSSPALDAAALQMLRLFTVHPFPDGNGRIARLLAQCDLVGAGLLPGLLLDLDGWVDANREAHDLAVVAAADGDLPRWGALFARAVAETARHRTGTLAEHRRILDTATARVADDPVAIAVLGALRSAPAVSAESLRGLLPEDPRPALARLRSTGILVPHPRLPEAFVHPGLLAVLDAPYTPPGTARP
ncbi:Fic family protein [Kitasatospora sp. NPDC094019]|uniref:Fic family protein n=1 Tax=Kitasatospora sp. NPDC094019 TaxID=3364091 RepID=UPI0037FEB767